MQGRSFLHRPPLVIAASVVVAVVITSCTTSSPSDHAPTLPTPPSPSQSAQTPVSNGTGLHVQGNQIVNGRGQAIRLVGFNMSGTDSKSGGPDYLYLFSQGKAVGEKIS